MDEKGEKMFYSMARFKKTGLISGFVFVFVVVGNTLAMADVEQVKLYKTAFPGGKPKCLFCHIDKLPKKDEGMHEPNAYGKKIQEAAEITADTYKQVGTYEDFEAQQNQVQEGGK
ncbi:MAG: hypothetical protein A3G91_00360 [Omnitrophica WOR_2 bacterium RIFCSPLOWO2_12_FULL_50_9]|nr:MAG: hypothetical protein A3G91_00360 [Omnitrophica WOR_2 bacterium RIFCSPLOWO2_12_FULL_50_9]